MSEKVLIANRGEIAVRIIRACHELGLGTIAIYSKGDKDELHTKLADERICIGGDKPQESYLNIPSIISSAEALHATLIHPGYGFLSENAEFAEICGRCGFTFIGPLVRNIRAMADKAKSRRIAEKAGIPTINGFCKPNMTKQDAFEIAKNIGFPVLLKSCQGGGGRGMKIVRKEEDFSNLYDVAKQEVQNAFGDSEILIEKFLTNVRHIEVQILGDRLGNIITIGTRDCSMQRRYQKVLEEACAPNIPADLENEIKKASLKIAESVNYSSLGTVEFLVDVKNNRFYFIEMNTRLQVEHPVTEMVTGIDLVKEQIKVSLGEELSLTQDDVKTNGHAIEVRINAEDEKTGFPSSGVITRYHAPTGMGVRVESALYQGCKVSPFYDSLVSKVICHASNRKECIKKVLTALDEYLIEGVKTNIEKTKKILNNKDFEDVKFYTKFLEDNNI